MDGRVVTGPAGQQALAANAAGLKSLRPAAAREVRVVHTGCIYASCTVSSTCLLNTGGIATLRHQAVWQTLRNRTQKKHRHFDTCRANRVCVHASTGGTCHCWASMPDHNAAACTVVHPNFEHCNLDICLSHTHTLHRGGVTPISVLHMSCVADGASLMTAFTNEIHVVRLPRLHQPLFKLRPNCSS